LQINNNFVNISLMFAGDIEQVLQKVGLKDHEAKVYFACLQSPQGLKVQEITNTTRIKRSTVDFVLKNLTSKGFVTYHLDGARKTYTAESPQAILYNLEDATNQFKSIIPLLMSSNIVGVKSKVRFYQGEDAMVNVLNDILFTLSWREDKQKELIGISAVTDLENSIPASYHKRWVNKRVSCGIPLRWIVRESDKIWDKYIKTAKENLRQMRFIDDKKYPLNIDMWIYGESVAFTSYENELSAVIIENQLLSQSFRSIFNALWDSLPQLN